MLVAMETPCGTVLVWNEVALARWQDTLHFFPPGASAFGQWQLCVCGKEGLAWVTVLEGLQQPALKGMGEGPRGRAPLSSLVQAAPTSSAPKAAPHP